MKALATKHAPAIPLDPLSDQDLARVIGGSGTGAQTPGLGKPLKVTPISTYMQSHPLPASNRVNLGNYNHPHAGGHHVSVSGGQGRPTQFTVGVSGGNGSTVTSMIFSGSLNPSANHSLHVGIGKKF